jgi:hypothetical protein
LLLATAALAHGYGLSDVSGLGARYLGIGGLSGGGATSVFLPSYPQPQRDEILDFLFKPGFGASLQLLKVEIGGDVQSTDGSEASHMHTREDLSCARGYETWLIAEAKRRNPALLTYGLSWGVPRWVGDGRGNGTGFYSPDNWLYHVRWLECVRNVTGYAVDWMGTWNEKPPAPIDFVIGLRAALDAALRLRDGEGVGARGFEAHRGVVGVAQPAEGLHARHLVDVVEQHLAPGVAEGVHAVGPAEGVATRDGHGRDAADGLDAARRADRVLVRASELFVRRRVPLAEERARECRENDADADRAHLGGVSALLCERDATQHREELDGLGVVGGVVIGILDWSWMPLAFFFFLRPMRVGGGCSYFAPVRTMQIKPGFVHDYTIHLTIGTAEEMRQRFGDLRKAAAAPKPAAGGKEH